MCGSTIVNVPPVKLIRLFGLKKVNKAVPDATELVALPPALPSILMLPPLWLKKEFVLLIKLPYTLSVPLLTVNVPARLLKVLLFTVLSVIPKLTVPPLTRNDAPVLLVIPVAATALTEVVKLAVPLLFVNVPLLVKVDPTFNAPLFVMVLVALFVSVPVIVTVPVLLLFKLPPLVILLEVDSVPPKTLIIPLLVTAPVKVNVSYIIKPAPLFIVTIPPTPGIVTSTI